MPYQLKAHTAQLRAPDRVYAAILPITAHERRDIMIKLTSTMLNKSIIDCNAACRAVALEVGVDFDTMAPGDRAVIPARWLDTGDASEIRFYRTNNARGDRRISIKGISQHAIAGNTLHLIPGHNGEIYIEVVA